MPETSAPIKFYQIWQSGLGEVILMMARQYNNGHHGITIAHHEHYVLR